MFVDLVDTPLSPLEVVGHVVRGGTLPWYDARMPRGRMTSALRILYRSASPVWVGCFLTFPACTAAKPSRHPASAPSGVLGHAASAPSGVAGKSASGPPTVIAHAVLSEGAGDAVLIENGRIATVGASDDLVGQCAPPCTVVDAKGAFLMPGFHDAHVHVWKMGVQDSQLSVPRGPLAGIQRAVRDFSAAHPSERWIIGHGWSPKALGALPTHTDLDAAEAQRPVVLEDQSGHVVWANWVALAIANVNARTPDPPGGRIVRGAHGAPTGIFEDGARALLFRHVPEPRGADIKESILRGQALSLRSGYTAADGGPVPLSVARQYRALADSGRLAQRSFLWASLDISEKYFADWVEFARSLPPEGLLRVSAFKGYVDGIPDTHTMAFEQPYPGTRHERGTVYLEPATLERLVVRANEAGFPVALHAEGDRAVRVALDAFEASARRTGRRLPNRVEHALFIATPDVGRFGALGVVASVQPGWIRAYSAKSSLLVELGDDPRVTTMYRFRDLAAAGAVLAFGTDFPSTGFIDPIVGMAAAVDRKMGNGVRLGPEQALDAETAFRAATRGTAVPDGEAAALGRLRVGAPADIILLAQDPRHNARSLEDDPLLASWVAGVRVSLPARALPAAPAVPSLSH